MKIKIKTRNGDKELVKISSDGNVKNGNKHLNFLIKTRLFQKANNVQRRYPTENVS